MPKPPSIFIIPFRFYKGHIEILLKTHAKKLEQNYISDISGPLHNDDPSPIFAAARIFLTDFLKMNYKLDEKVLKISKHFIYFLKKNINWDTHEFRKWLGKICSAFEYYESDTCTVYFIEDYSLLSNYNGRINPDYNFSWYRVKELQDQINRFSPSLCILIHYELGGIKEFLTSRSMEKKVYGILNTEPDESWDNVYEACYQGYFQRPHEKWVSFRVSRDHFPSEEVENNVKGWIITGSNCATYQKEAWMFKLYELIRRIVNRKGTQKLLGFCFGHQSIAVALGGSVERMKNLDLDVMLLYKNRIYLKPEFLGTNYLKNSLAFQRINVTRGIYLNQAHGDYVVNLPKCSTHFGYFLLHISIPIKYFRYSDDIENEIMGVEDFVLSMQSHPEFSESMMIYRWLPEILKNRSELEEYRRKCIQSYYLGELHSQEMRMVCEAFLKSEAQQ